MSLIHRHPRDVVPGIWRHFRYSYALAEFLAAGAEGQAWTVTKHTNSQVYVAKFQREPRRWGKGLYDARLLRDMMSPQNFLVLFTSELFCPYDGSGILIMEWCEAFDLRNLLMNYGDRGVFVREPFLWYVFSEVANAITYLHDHSIIHQDLKPDNLLLSWSTGGQFPRSRQRDYPYVKIADFGHAEVTSDSTFNPKYGQGTIPYQPPEIPYCSYSSDVWALGATIHEMMFGALPIPPGFSHWNAEARELCRPDQLRPLPYMHCWNSAYSTDLYKLMMSCLVFERSRRNCAYRLKNALRIVRPARIMSDYRPLPPWATAKNPRER